MFEKIKDGFMNCWVYTIKAMWTISTVAYISHTFGKAQSKKEILNELHKSF